MKTSCAHRASCCFQLPPHVACKPHPTAVEAHLVRPLCREAGPLPCLQYEAIFALFVYHPGSDQSLITQHQPLTLLSAKVHVHSQTCVISTVSVPTVLRAGQHPVHSRSPGRAAAAARGRPAPRASGPSASCGRSRRWPPPPTGPPAPAPAARAPCSSLSLHF